eukprot:scaffold8589_cov50-Phaeocystis_antarctica.AAC.1
MHLDAAQVVEREPAVRARVLPWVLSPAEQRRAVQLAAALAAIEEGQPPPQVDWRVQRITRRRCRRRRRRHHS